MARAYRDFVVCTVACLLSLAIDLGDLEYLTFYIFLEYDSWTLPANQNCSSRADRLSFNVINSFLSFIYALAVRKICTTIVQQQQQQKSATETKGATTPTAQRQTLTEKTH